MPRQPSVSAQNNFSRGLITEATGLNFPEDACTETYNCVFERKGSVRRRLGIDFETDYETQAVDRSGNVVTSYYWQSAAGNGDNTLAVVQVGTTLYFYSVSSSALSSDMIDTIDLTDFEVAGAPDVGEVECQFAGGNGYLFVSHPYLESFYVEYDGSTTVTGTAITLRIRDFEGIEDNLDIDERPSTLTDEHHYNLFNQGWYVDDVTANTGGPVQVLDYWDSLNTDFPSNADIWWLHRSAANNDWYNPSRTFFASGNSPAPKGHYLLNPYYQDRSDVSGIGSFTAETSGFYRASTIAFFAGRVWYSGVTGQDYSNRIYFTQIIESEKQFGWCFQQNDPTSEDKFDILPSDGGVITIPEAGTIIKLWPIENSLLVFASNGVWGITGSQGIGFTATDFSVTKLSDIGALTASSFVSIGGFPAWWNEEDIYVASGQDAGGSIQVTPIVEDSIRTFFEDIPASSKRYVHGAFNTRTRVVHWAYRSTEAANITEAYEFDRILNLNTVTKALYPWSIDNDPVSINGIMVVEGQGSEGSLIDVTDSLGNVVTNAALDDVQVFGVVTVDLSAATKFITSYDDTGYLLTFSDEKDIDYLDWVTYDDVGVDFSSYFVTGYAVRGDAQRKHQPSYVYIYNATNDQENQFDFRSQWNYATSGNTGRWSSTQRLIFPSDDYTYQYKRIKTRGHGIVLQFRVDSVTGEPFEVIGWSVFETINSGV